MLCGHCFRETMKLTAEVRRQGGGGKTGEHRQIDTDSQQLNALFVGGVFLCAHAHRRYNAHAPAQQSHIGV